MLLRLCPQVRDLIYRYIVQQPEGELLGLSREPAHDYDHGPPIDWIADSRQNGFVFGSDTDMIQPTNFRFLRTCRLINCEATPVFYGTNKIILYAEDNNDIFYWLIDIGERNRRAIRHLEINRAYGVSIESARKNIHGILQNVEDMEASQEDEIQKRRQQLVRIAKGLENKIVDLIIRTLYLISSNQDLVSLAVYFPGVDGGDIWDLQNENLFFAEEIFSNSTENIYACVPEALGKIVGIETLSIGYTKDIELAEKVARMTGTRQLTVRTCSEGHSLNLDRKEQANWLEKGWRLEGKTAHTSLVVDGEGRFREELEGIGARTSSIVHGAARIVVSGFSDISNAASSTYIPKAGDEGRSWPQLPPPSVMSLKSNSPLNTTDQTKSAIAF